MNSAESEHLSSLRESIELCDVPIELTPLVQSAPEVSVDLTSALCVEQVALPALEARSLPAFERPLQPGARDVPLLTKVPWVRTLGKLTLELRTQGWRFPAPGEFVQPPVYKHTLELLPNEPNEPADLAEADAQRTRLRPPSDMVMFKDRLLYLLQPPLEDIFHGKQVHLPFPP